MIQAVADDNERGELGMHYTSVPNILKVLNPLFLDSLNADLEKAGNNKQQLGKLKNVSPESGFLTHLISRNTLRKFRHQAMIEWNLVTSSVGA